MSQCGIEKLCRVSSAWQRVNAAIRRALEDVTLHQLAGLDSVGVRVATLAAEIRQDGFGHKPAEINTAKINPEKMNG